MDAQATGIARLRLPAVSPRAFLALAWAALGAMFVVTVTGATVRLTGSGLGCDNWPRCGETLLPEKSFHPLVEFSNRGVGIAVGLVSLAAALGAWRVRGLPRALLFAAVALPGTILLQGVLGGITVLTDLHPLIVMGHFLLSLAAVALGVAVVLEARAFAAGPGAAVVPGRLALLSLLLLPVLVALVVTGALVTAAGPHSGGVGIRRFGSFEEAVDVHVAAAGVFGVGFLLLAAWLYRLRRAARPELLLAAAVLALLFAQTAVGETQYRSGQPWWLVLVHVTLATATFGAMFALAWRLGRRAGRA
jgi:cytochrome c oxidase assembly protein subunit 15